MIATSTIYLVIIFLVLLLTSAPIAVAMGLTAFSYFLLFTNFPLTQLADNLFNGLNKFPLMAVPFFVLAANIMSQGGISARIVTAANALVGHIKGGLGVTAVLSCIFFAAISGSSPATVVAVGTLLIPEMIRAGYGKRFATGIIATSGSLGILIPPSIALIVYGIATEVSIGALFLGGILPGLLGGVMIIILVLLMTRFSRFGGLKHTQPVARLSTRERLRTFGDGALSLFLPVFVLGGIYGGFFTPTEAAGMAVFYALIVTLFVYKEIRVRDLFEIALKSARTSAMILFIIANAMIFSFVLSYERIPAQVTAAIFGMDLKPWEFLIILNMLLLIVGAFMDTISALVILAPIMLPIGLALDIHPVHLGIIMVMNLEIGLITPPFGVNLFVASGMSRVPPMQVAVGAAPSALVLFLALLIVTYVPFLTLAFIQ